MSPPPVVVNWLWLGTSLISGPGSGCTLSPASRAAGTDSRSSRCRPPASRRSLTGGTRWPPPRLVRCVEPDSLRPYLSSPCSPGDGNFVTERIMRHNYASLIKVSNWRCTSMMWKWPLMIFHPNWGVQAFGAWVNNLNFISLASDYYGKSHSLLIV